MPEECWKDIEGFPGYQISDHGRVRSFHNNRYGIRGLFHVLKPGLSGDGYYTVSLYKDKKAYTQYIHALLSDAFIGKREKNMTVNHKDGDKTNNDLSNLEIVTYSGNLRHAYENGLNKHPKPVRIVETGEIFKSRTDCAKAIDGCAGNITYCLNGKLKSHKGLHFEDISRDYFEKPTNQKQQAFLYDYQMDAVNRMKNGCILCGSVGSGKSRTGLFYYFKENGGWIDGSDYTPMINPSDLIIITTAKKRNSYEWLGELAYFRISDKPELNYYKNKVVVDSWNNLPKYKDVENAFFLFDEQRLVGSGAWVKSFLKIAKRNRWILLSATPGDSYMDFLPVFLANGFFKNKTEFAREHIIYSRFTKYPKIDRFIGTQRLEHLRRQVLVEMDYKHEINAHHEDVYCRYDIAKYKDTMRSRFDPFKNEPIQQASGLCYVLRRIVNSDESRQAKVLEILEDHPKAIIFYSFDHELEILKKLAYGDGVVVAEYNGHRHDPTPTGEKWVYLCQYTSACEGWECTETNCIIFYSQNYSYKVMQQAAGRIDRLNTPFKDLYYYHLKTRSGIDLAISKALSQKKQFNESRWVKW